MNAKNFNRQVFVVEDDNPIDDYSRKRSQEEFLPRKSKSFSRDFPSFKESVSSGASFIKTPKGLAIVITIILIGGLILAGGIAGLVYYLGYSLNATTYTIAPNTTTTTPASIIDSIILTTQEKNNLIALGGFKSFVLCFRGSRDGFYVNVFHRLCDNKIQTVSIIRSHLNSVFGGYTAQTWNAINTYKSDSTAWIFSLRRRGVTNSERFNVTISGWAMYAHTNFGNIIDFLTFVIINNKHSHLLINFFLTNK